MQELPNDLDVQYACARLPRAEVTAVRDQVGVIAFSKRSLEQWIQDIVVFRMKRAVCNQCFRFGEGITLDFCKGCHCTWYCSSECQERDVRLHAHWCGQLGAPPDMGPLRVCVRVNDAQRGLYELKRMERTDAIDMNRLYRSRKEHMRFECAFMRQVTETLDPAQVALFSNALWCDLLAAIWDRIYMSNVAPDSSTAETILSAIVNQLLGPMIVCALQNAKDAPVVTPLFEHMLITVHEMELAEFHGTREEAAQRLKEGPSSRAEYTVPKQAPDQKRIVIRSNAQEHASQNQSVVTSLTDEEVRHCKDRRLLKELGNAAWKRGDLEYAMCCYTRAMRLAPPLWNELDTTILMNRAKLFGQMNLWMYALMDIALLSVLGSQPTLPGKAYRVNDVVAKIECLQKLEAHREAQSVYESELFTHPRLSDDDRKHHMQLYSRLVEKAQLRGSHTTSVLRQFVQGTGSEILTGGPFYPVFERSLYERLEAPSDQPPFANENQRMQGVVCIQKRGSCNGWGVIALKAFKKGDEIYAERAAAVATTDSDRCACCMRTNARSPCSNACGEMYCSASCRQTAAGSFHGSRVCSTVVQEHIKKYRAGANQASLKAASSVRIPLLLGRLLSSLPPHQSILEHPSIRMFELPYSTSGTVRYADIEASSSRWQTVLAFSRANPLYIDFATFECARLLLSHMTSDLATCDEVRSNRPASVFGLFTVTNCINHACKPNAMRFTDVASRGAEVVLTATRNISPGDEISVDYLFGSSYADASVRRKQLKEKFDFECMCVDCVAQSPLAKAAAPFV